MTCLQGELHRNTHRLEPLEMQLHNPWNQSQPPISQSHGSQPPTPYAGIETSSAGAWCGAWSQGDDVTVAFVAPEVRGLWETLQNAKQ